MQTPEKTTEILIKEIESLNSIETRDLVLFYYKINYQHFNLATFGNFNEFLKSFDFRFAYSEMAKTLKELFNKYLLAAKLRSFSDKNKFYQIFI